MKSILIVSTDYDGDQYSATRLTNLLGVVVKIYNEEDLKSTFDKPDETDTS